MITAAGLFLHALAWSFAMSGGVYVGRWDKTKVRADLRTGIVTMAIAALIQIAAIVVMP